MFYFSHPPLAPKPRTDRSALDACFTRRRGADDVIIVRRGLLTDTTVANLALFDPHTARWYTPAVPLLAGTHRSALLSAGVLTPLPDLTPESLARFTRLRLFNALLGWASANSPSPPCCAEPSRVPLPFSARPKPFSPKNFPSAM